MNFRLAVLMFALVFLATGSSFSQSTYHWTDEKGTVHFTDDLSKIPSQYRNQIKIIKAPETPPTKTDSPPKPEKSDERVRKYLEEYDRKVAEKRELEKRAAELEEELEYSEARLREIDELEREDFNYYSSYRQPGGRFVAVGSPYYDEKVKLEKRVREIKPELESLREKISKIRRSL